MDNTHPLLAPRYKVIADYPRSFYTLGEVIECDAPDHQLAQWPAIFKPLQWWEERTLEEMPMYLKQIGRINSEDKPIPDRVIKVSKHWANTATHPHGNYKIFSSSDDPHNEFYSQMYFDWQPATESEYLAYQQSLTREHKEGGGE